MKTDRIDFISSYCDRWCERCGYTSRCAAFATRVAIAMCGDAAEGLELAVGTPRGVSANEDGPSPQALPDAEQAVAPVNEVDDFSRKWKARRARIDDMLAMKVAWAVSIVAHRWLTAHPDAEWSGSDTVLADALETAGYDKFLITAKLHRAFDGREREAEDGSLHDDPIQTDWNGSAKVALISIERSEAAWRLIAGAAAEETPLAIADQLRDLRRLVEKAFPDAWTFVRPGFDEPGR